MNRFWTVVVFVAALAAFVVAAGAPHISGGG
jgi:hypothetical protein